MRAAVATVLSARPWESALVSEARRRAVVRIVGRAYDPQDLISMGSIDAVVVGSETSWLSPPLVRAWRSRGWRVLGVHPAHDMPGRGRLLAGGADLVVPDRTPPEDLLHSLASWAVVPPPPARPSRVIGVTGARGAPGRTTVAVALARASAPKTLLLDADPLPNVAVALGLGPGPELDALIGGLRSDTGFIGLAHPEEGLAVLCPESAGNPMAAALVSELATSLRSEFDTIVIDTGPPSFDLPRMLRACESSVLVVDGTSQGIIRAAHLVGDWSLEPPAVILNRAPEDAGDLMRACRAALGLEPLLVPRFHADPVEGMIPHVAGLVS